VMLVGCNDA